MTELIWDGKYKDGKKQGPVRIALPFQTIETVNESAQDRLRTLELFAQGRPTEWRNRLIWGDKKYVLPSLLPEFAGKVNLIYIDPPFDTGANFSFSATIPEPTQVNPRRDVILGPSPVILSEAKDPRSSKYRDSSSSRHRGTPQNDTPAEQLTFTKEPSILEQKAYRDTWGRGLDSYLQWFYEAVILLHELVAEDGAAYVHLDWHVVHYAKAVLDEVFGGEQFQNQIVWPRTNPQKTRNGFGRVHDAILFYTKSQNFAWNPQLRPLSEKHLERHYRREDGQGRRYDVAELTAPGTTKGPSGQPWRGFDVASLGRHWRMSPEKLDELDKRGQIYWPPKGGFPRLIRYLDEVVGTTVGDVWDDVSPLNMVARERLDYPTQKPEALLERVIKASSNEGDLVLDCFVGSGTTAAVAEKLNRRWIACDLGRFAIHTTRKRLLGIAGVKPFVVQNLGKYERQAWQVAEFAGEPNAAILRSAQDDSREGCHSEPVGRRAKNPRSSECRDSSAASQPQNDMLQERQAREMAYRKFILDLYHATPVSGYSWLHGTKAGRMVHVGAVDAPVTLADVKAIAKEVWKVGDVAHVILSEAKNPGISELGNYGDSSPAARAQNDMRGAGVKAAADILGWEFAFELNETAKQTAAESRVNVTFRKIPHEALDKKAVEQGDIKFFELGALAVDVKIKKREVSLKLTDFAIPIDDIPEEVRKAIKHWSQLVDYWAVDWDYKDDTFHNQWQSYRTRKDPKISLDVNYLYPEAGKYTIVVKVIDILGNDTTKTLEVVVK